METPTETGRWKMPRLTLTRGIVIALAASLIFSGYLILRPDVRAVLFSSATAKGEAVQPTPPVAQPASDPAAQPSPVSTQNLAASDLDVLMAQLQEMQSFLQSSAIQLEQKSQAAGLPASGAAAQPSPYGEDLPALMAEIEQLYQEMQPLMVQLEVATASQSSRSATELSALRAQVDFIHQRLDYLLMRLEIAQSQAQGGTTTTGHGMGAAPWADRMGGTTNAPSPEQVQFDQLYQSMVHLQQMLQQMQTLGQSGQ